MEEMINVMPNLPTFPFCNKEKYNLYFQLSTTLSWTKAIEIPICELICYPVCFTFGCADYVRKKIFSDFLQPETEGQNPMKPTSLRHLDQPGSIGT